jgi:poly-gamma-glutamate synthesis protein (capsule biosynthesis protein)
MVQPVRRPRRRQRRLRAWHLLLVVVVLVVAAGVAALWLSRGDAPGVAAAPTADVSDRQSEGGGTGGTSSGSTSTSAPATTTTLRDPVLGNGTPVTLAFAGDTNFEGVIADRLAADPASVFGPIVPVLSGADLTVVNMETAIGNGGAAADKEFTFQAPPEALESFRAAGVDVVSAANNHGMDFGPESLEETLAAEAASGFPVIGIGRDEDEAFAPFVTEVQGQRIAVIAATQVLDASLLDQWTAGEGKPGLASAKRVDRLTAEVEAARAVADTVVVFLHWGVEGQTCPSASQQELARQLVDAGADVIVGGHAHRLQGGGRLGDAMVHYGLGNFAFYAGSPEGARTGVLRVTVTGRRVDGYEWVPARIVDRQPQPLTGAEAAAELAQWESQRACTGLAP